MSTLFRIPVRFHPVILLLSTVAAQAASALAARGYAVLPEPRRVTLGAADLAFGPAFGIEHTAVGPDDFAVASLREGLAARLHLTAGRPGRSTTAIALVLAPGKVEPGEALDAGKASIAAQAYRIDLHAERITITANAPAGLFYGAQTLMQLVAPRQGGGWRVPEGTIEDWPDLGLRQIYWDDAHHLDRMETLRAAIAQAAFYKINGFIIKLEGHFQYASAPAIVEPYALSPAELQSLTDFARRHYVELIPYLDGPAHIAFILKHPEYARLRAFPDSNYEGCATNPAFYQLLYGMFGDLLAANRGGKYFYLSTDEAYYIGKARNAQCDEASRAAELGSPGKLLAEFVTKAAGWLHERGRTVVFWGEYPLTAGDIDRLPPYLVNGETYGPQFDPLFAKHGIRSMIYTSTQGEERHFPEYELLPPDRRVHPRRGAGTPRVEGIARKIATDPARRTAEVIGAVNAGWADAGSHPETFWLGYAAGTSAAWNPEAGIPETVAAFYRQFYGPSASRMDRLYRLMSWQAQFWSDSWETGPSTARKPIWGNSNSIFEPKRPAQDQFLPLPPAPGTDFAYSSKWSEDNARRLELAGESLTENGELLGLLEENLRRAEFNRYNLEVLESVARLLRHNLEMLLDIGRMDADLKEGAAAARKGDAGAAVAAADRALARAAGIRARRNRVLGEVTAVWSKSWFPRVESANGRRLLHELDDVKDHRGDRTVDLSYQLQREMLLPFGQWVESIWEARNRYAAANRLPPNGRSFDWNNRAAGR